MKTSTIIVIAAAALIAGCGQVDTGEAGFFTRWGEITSKQPLEEGLHFYEPWGTDLVTYNIKNQTITVRTPVFTKDVQTMSLDLAVTFNLDKNKVIDLHRSTGRDYSKVLVHPSVLAAAKDALGKMEAGDIVSQRETATKSIFESIRDRLKPYGINIVMVNITNIDYSDAFERAVEEKQVALQQSQKEKNETIKKQEVARQRVIEAEAESQSAILKAKAEAEAISLKAEAEAKSIELRNKALAQSRALIEYETVKTWDGRLPVQMLGNAPVPFLKLGEGVK